MKNTNTQVTYKPLCRKNETERLTAQFNAKLAALRSLLAEHEETYADAVQYAKLGTDWREKEVIQNARQDMEKTGMPPYMWDIVKQKALDAYITDDMRRYWNDIQEHLNIEAEHEGKTWRLPLSCVDVTPDSWRVSKAWQDAHEADITRTLEPYQVKDMAKINAFIAAACEIIRRGYSVQILIDSYLNTRDFDPEKPPKVEPEWIATIHGTEIDYREN